ncbi:MAG: HEAT repeat domain-containing protein, partial [Bradymonadia bacterium]
MKTNLNKLTVVLLVAFAFVSQGEAKRKRVSSKAVLKEAKAAVEKVAESSDHRIRLAVFDARVKLARKSAPVVKDGLASEILLVKRKAVAIALSSKNRKLRAQGVSTVGQMLCSEAPEQVAAGQGLRLRIRDRKSRRMLQSLVVDCPGSGLAEEAKQQIIQRGGGQGWSLLEKDIQNTKDLVKRDAAFRLALQARSKASAAWAIKNIHSESEIGELARDIMINLAGTRLGRSYVGRLKKEYRLAKKQDKFAKRLRLAMLLGNLSGVKGVQDTLFAAFSPNYRAPEGITNTQERAWKGLRNVRSFKVLNRDISRKHKLKVKDLFCTVKNEGEAKAAFDWLYAWTKKTQSKKLYDILTQCFKSDHTHARIASIKVLAKLGSRKTLPVFEAALKESNPIIRHAGARGIAAVAKKGDEARLGKLLQREREEDGKLALIAGLRRIGTKESIAPLKFMVFRQPKSVTLAVVDALAATKDPAITKNIASLKSSSDSEIRMKVWKHLLSLDPDKYVTAFVTSATAWVKPRHVQEFSRVKEIPLRVYARLAAKASLEVSAQALEVLSKGGKEGASLILD